MAVLVQKQTSGKYWIECSPIELECIRQCMRLVELGSKPSVANIEFSADCATIINKALVANGD